MREQFSDDLDRFVRSQVASGHYPSEADVLRDMRAWIDSKEARLAPRQEGESPADDRTDWGEPGAGPLWGLYRDEPEFIDQIVAEAMRDREWRYRKRPDE